MSDQLNKKLARRKALRLMFENTALQARVCLENSDTPQAKFISIKTSLSEYRENLNNIDEEIFNLVELENVENEALERIRFLEPFHDIMAEVSLQLEKFDVTSIPVTTPSSSGNTNCKLPKLELPTFQGILLIGKASGTNTKFQLIITKLSVISTVLTI